jgi:nitrous oxide reductase accessory protein NosL
MRKGLMLLTLAAILLTACAETNSDSRNRDSMIDRANICATCGGAVSDNYFSNSAFKAIGPGSY